LIYKQVFFAASRACIVNKGLAGVIILLGIEKILLVQRDEYFMF
jgi:hypothetical protein